MSKNVDKYSLIECLKDEDHCKIYRGLDRETEEIVYIKSYPLGYLDNHKDLTIKIYGEMTIMEYSESKRIASTLGYLQTNNNMYHVFKFRESLLKELKRGNFEEKEALGLLKEMVICLNELHSNGIIHRNLSPSCFLISGKELILTKLFDAIQIDNSKMENKSVFKLKEYYVAPENLENKGGFDKASDVFSLGVIFYEILFKSFPYSKDQIENYKKIKESGSFSIFIPGSVSDLTQNLLKKMLCFDPSKRPNCENLINMIQLNKLNIDEDLKSPENLLKNCFDIFLERMNFLNNFGNFLNKKHDIFETAVFYHYLVMKKIYVVIKNYKKYLGFNINESEFNEIDLLFLKKIKDFINKIERESLSQLIAFQNNLQENLEENYLPELCSDLESLEDFKNFDVFKKIIIQPLIEYNTKVFNEKKLELLSNQFVINEEEKNFQNYEKKLLVKPLF